MRLGRRVMVLLLVLAGPVLLLTGSIIMTSHPGMGVALIVAGLAVSGLVTLIIIIARKRGRWVMGLLLLLAGPVLLLFGFIGANSNDNWPGGLAVALMAAGAAISAWVTVRIIIVSVRYRKHNRNEAPSK